MRTLLEQFGALLGRCGHARTAFPQTPVRRCGPHAETYIVCLDCGEEFAYDWQGMRVQRADWAPIPKAKPDAPEWAR
jgi:hypothetical protein